MMLYHMNMGYPLLDENAELTIPSNTVAPRDSRAAEDIDSWQRMLKPQANFVEQCYYHSFEGETGFAQLINRKAGVGVKISFPTDPFCCFTQWKQMSRETARRTGATFSAAKESSSLLNPANGRPSCLRSIF